MTFKKSLDGHQARVAGAGEKMNMQREGYKRFSSARHSCKRGAQALACSNREWPPGPEIIRSSLGCSGFCRLKPALLGLWNPAQPAKDLGVLGTGLLALILAGCAIVSPLPPANLKEPGWTVHEGQAVWHLAHAQGGREIAGDVLVATRHDGNAFVQFSKSPFPLVIAQAGPRQWQVEFPPQNKHYAGRGKPSKRVIWLYLPLVLAGQPPPAGWTWHQGASGWKLQNGATGESLEGFFDGNA